MIDSPTRPKRAIAPTVRSARSPWQTATALLSGTALCLLQVLPMQAAIAQSRPDPTPDASDADNTADDTDDAEAISPLFEIERFAADQHREISEYFEMWLRDRLGRVPDPTLPRDRDFPAPSISPRTTPPIDRGDWTAYRLAPGDALSVVVQPPFEDLSTSGEISFQGTLFVPLLGTVSLEGLTVQEATNRLTRALNQFVVNPDVQVVLASPRQPQVTVTGEVARPGFFPVNPNAPLIQALLAAGGVTLDADLRRVAVERSLADGSRVAQTFDFYTPLTLGGAVPDVRLRDSDVVFVPTRPRGFEAEYDREVLERAALTTTAAEPVAITVTGEVVRPGYYDFNSRPAPEVDGAILAAQGTKTTADLRQIIVRRTLNDGTQTEQRVDLFTPLLRGEPLPRVPLEDGDVVFVPELAPEDREAYNFDLATRTTLTQQQILVRLLSYPSNGASRQQLPVGSRLADVLTGVPLESSRLGRVALIRFDEELGEPVTSYYDGREALLGNLEENPLLQDRDVVVVGRNFIAKLGNFINTFTQPFRDVLGFLLFFDQLSESADNLFRPTGTENNNNNNN